MMPEALGEFIHDVLGEAECRDATIPDLINLSFNVLGAAIYGGDRTITLAMYHQVKRHWEEKWLADAININRTLQ